MSSVRWGRVAAVLVLASASVLGGISSASAHAGIESSSPTNGAQLDAAPGSVLITFGEQIKLDGKGTRIIDGTGARVPAKARAKGTQVILTPTKTLKPGRYAAAWHLISVDGDAVEGAISFTVATTNPAGTPVLITTVPKVPTSLSAAMVGSRTLFFTTTAKTGEVDWTSASVPEEITWTVKGNGTKAAAKGVLPTPGTWSFTATLEKGTSVVIVKGKVTISG